jgi:hypothetical protein
MPISTNSNRNELDIDEVTSRADYLDIEQWLMSPENPDLRVTSDGTDRLHNFYENPVAVLEYAYHLRAKLNELRSEIDNLDMSSQNYAEINRFRRVHLSGIGNRIGKIIDMANEQVRKEAKSNKIVLE